MDFIGTSGKDNYAGTVNADNFDMSQGGNDTITGDDGGDVVEYGAAMTSKDKFDGGDGADEVVLDGDYSAGLTLGSNSFTSVERMSFVGGHSYDITLLDDNTSSIFTVVASALTASDQLIFTARKDTDTFFNISDGAGDDILKGGDFAGAFNLSLGGADTVYGGAGIDQFLLNGTLDPADKLRGGGGSDYLSLYGDYSAGLTLTHSMMRDIELVQIVGAFDYALTTDDGLISAGGILSVTTGPLSAGHIATFDGSAETDGSFAFTGGAADDSFIGGDGDDVFTFTIGTGVDFADGGDGDDTFDMTNTFDAGDTLDGHHGTDSLQLSGDYSGGVTLAAGTIHAIEEILLFAGNSYDLTMDDANVGAGDTLSIDASALNVLDALTFNGSAELDASFEVVGGDFDDTIKGGAGADILTGGDGEDILAGHDGDDILAGGRDNDQVNGGDGSDTFLYTGVLDSTNVNHDVLGTFNTNVDLFDLPVTVSGVDTKITVGTLNSATFVSDLVNAVNSGNLAAGHAVLFKPNAGDLANHIFLCVDANGAAGYQSFADFVIEIQVGVGLNSLSTADFI